MNQLKRGRFSCPDCGSSDGLAYYEDASHCFSCGKHTVYGDDHPRPSASDITTIKSDEVHILNRPEELHTLPLTDRSISKETAEKYGVKVELSPTTGQPYRYWRALQRGQDNPKIIGYNIRFLEPGPTGKKRFLNDPAGADIDKRAMLFGQHLFPPGCAKSITITEGFEDAMAGYEMFGSKYPFVSVLMGSDSAVSDCRRQLQYLESFENVVICFDRDTPGQKAAIECAQLFSPGKCKIVALDTKLKDANEYKKQGKAEQFTKAWWTAQPYRPSNILSSSQLKDRIRNRPRTQGIPYAFQGLNDLTYGIRKGEAVIITAPTGVGKTTFLRANMINILREDKTAKIGAMFLEESPIDSGLGLMSQAAEIPFHLPDTQYTEEQYNEAEKILDEDRVYFFDHFGSTAIDDIISRVRYYARGLGCDYIFIDHLSIIVSDQQQGDERKKLDEVMTKLKTLTMELNIALLAVVHTNRQGQIRGTAGIEQLANIVIELERDIKSVDEIKRRTLSAVVAKNRFSGKTGPAFQALYNEEKGTLEERQYNDWIAEEGDLTTFFGSDIISSDDAEGVDTDVE